MLHTDGVMHIALCVVICMGMMQYVFIVCLKELHQERLGAGTEPDQSHPGGKAAAGATDGSPSGPHLQPTGVPVSF